MKHQIKKKSFSIIKICYTLLAMSSLTTLQSCKKYLDVVPDNVATIDNAFTLRTEAEKFLSTCYSYLPANGNYYNNTGLLAGDEMIIPTYYWNSFDFGYAFYIAKGAQNAATPFQNNWDGGNGGQKMWEGIRQCNIFLENVSDLSKVPDMTLDDRTRWLAEVTFLKAYYHYYLLTMYGPIPIIDVNLPVSASPEDVKVKRQPFDSCVNYIVKLLNKSIDGLPTIISNPTNEMGRITQPIALAVKAKLLVLAASPLFNGNPDYVSVVDKSGVKLFNGTYDVTKWEKARDAAKAAIDIAEANGFALYQYNGGVAMSDTAKRQLSIRNAVTERWNVEKIWGLSNSLVNTLQVQTMGITYNGGNSAVTTGNICAPMKMAELFYSKNGVPINEDKTLDFSNKAALRTAVTNERFNINVGSITARINFDREPRFYADLGFDGGIWYNYNSTTETSNYIQGLYSQWSNPGAAFNYNETGYWIKKLTEWTFSATASGSSVRSYEWPEIRLADLYLLYAEASNEASGPSEAAFTYLNKIRTRASLPTIQTSWTNFSTNPAKYTTQEGLRSIIKQERGIELAFEGKRFWDLRRWKDAISEINKPIIGWSTSQSTAVSYYQPRLLLQQAFVAPRDYLWPIRQYNIIVNPNLVQNPGW